jgi:hypothetical protein
MSSDCRVVFFSKAAANAMAVVDPCIELSNDTQKFDPDTKTRAYYKLPSKYLKKIKANESNPRSKQLRTHHTGLATAASCSFPKLWRRAQLPCLFGLLLMMEDVE